MARRITVEGDDGCRSNSSPGVARAGLKQIGVDEITQFRTTWTDAPITKYKKQERLKGFFHFCVAREWIRANLVALFKPVKVPPTPTLPFDEEQFAAILDACDRYAIMAIYNHGNRKRMKALTLLLRYSGLRIRDAVTCGRERLVGSKLFLYQAKTGTPVYCPLPPVVVDALKELEGPNPKYFFWTGNGNPKSVVADAQRSFRTLFKLADVRGAPAHVPRHVRRGAAEARRVARDGVDVCDRPSRAPRNTGGRDVCLSADCSCCSGTRRSRSPRSTTSRG